MATIEERFSFSGENKRTPQPQTLMECLVFARLIRSEGGNPGKRRSLLCFPNFRIPYGLPTFSKSKHSDRENCFEHLFAAAGSLCGEVLMARDTVDFVAAIYPTPNVKKLSNQSREFYIFYPRSLQIGQNGFLKPRSDFRF